MSATTAGWSYGTPSEFNPFAQQPGTARTSPHTGGLPAANHPAELHLPPGADAAQRLTDIQAARNPFLTASGPMLRALADMPADLEKQGMKGLQAVLEEEVKTFTRLCDQANLRREHMLAVRYALCTALDEAASLRPWGGGTGDSTGPWSEHALLQTFHQEGDGGNKVFLLIGRLAANPQEHLPVLEVMLHILGLGFMGHYRTQTDGPRMVETIRNRLYTLLAAAREPVSRELSPHWQGVVAGKFRLLRSVPVWVSATLLALLLLGLFAWYKYQLVYETQIVEKRIRDIGKQMPVAKRLRLKELLANEIAAGRVNVDEDDIKSKVTFRGDDMFLPGQAKVNPRMEPMLDKVAAGINEVSGAVEVIGHSDNQPIFTREFPNNVALSQKRAQGVADALRAKAVDPSRVATTGMGDSQPVTENATIAGRARNRRVEISVLAQ